MGLTIQYNLRAGTTSVKQVKELVSKLRQRALDLPFTEVGELVELNGPACNLERCGSDDPHRWLIIQAGQWVDRPAPRGGQYSYSVNPTHIIAFSTWPGQGCEQANFGLCRYPATIKVETETGRYGRSVMQTLRTKLAGWRWGSFCKTQYGSNPECGGGENFLRCHLLVIRMLDHAKSLGMLEYVDDEGGFWEQRDPKALVEEVGQWNEKIAAEFGKLKDQLGGNWKSPITEFPNFEHLEAKGRPQAPAA